MFYTPTVLTACRQEIDIAQREIFGPVIPVVTFDDLEQAITFANDSEYGLTSLVTPIYFLTRLMTQRHCCLPAEQIPLCLRKAAARRPSHCVPPHAWPRDTCERGILGALAVSLWSPGLQVAFPPAYPRYLADGQLLCLLATSVTGILWPQYEQRVSNWVSPSCSANSASCCGSSSWVPSSGSPRRPPPDPGGSQ